VSPTRLVDLIFLVVFIVIAIKLVPSAYRALRIYATLGSRRLEDATSFAPAEPAAVAQLSDRLVELGFSRVGVRSAILPDGIRRFEWDLVDEPTTTYVAVIPVGGKTGAAMASYSAFADGAFVETTHPRGATVRRSNLDARPAGQTPEESIGLHRERVTAFAADHGPPLTNRSMADLLVRDDTYRRIHGGAVIRRDVYTLVTLAALVVVAAAALFVRILVP
jgi:hypothetical protein